MRAHALFHVAPRRVECREVALAGPGPGEVLITSLRSALSPGTEALIFSGAFPQDLALDASIESLAGSFNYPFAYGYSLVGRVTQTGPGVDASWNDALVFVFHPHQDKIVVSLSACHRVPPGITMEAALFLPQVETALNLVMDGVPLIGERVMVFGLGVVGLLSAGLLAQFPLGRLVAVEPLAWRRELARHWGITETVDPTDDAQWHALQASLGGADLAFESSGDMAALALAIESAGFDGRIVIGSWYGTRSLPLDLGARFHRNRLRLISSQVSTLAPALTGRWDKPRRIALAWRMLDRLEPQRLKTLAFGLAQCQQAFEALCARQDEAMQVMFRYP